MGGQGGGVLSEWIVDAASRAGLAAHGTSIPGVAQRTGSTTYYVEVFTGWADAPVGCADAPVGAEGDMPAFSLYPIPGALDVLLVPELLELGRMVELGLPSPARTTIIASTHRLYSIHEKITTAGTLYPSERLLQAARAFSRRLVAFDALALAREHGTEANAVLLGALAGAEALPVPDDAYRAAIESRGIQVEANCKGFDAGRARARALLREGGDGIDADHARPRRAAPDDPLVAGLPEPVRGIARHAVVRLVDYQDRAYAERYARRLAPFVAPGRDLEVAGTVARLLAVWMTYEDAIRVADLKTRAARFERIRREAPVEDAEIVVTDYLKPDLDELYGILPYRLVAPFARWAERRWPAGRPSLAQHVRTTTVSGYLRVWALARLRRLRPVSYRARHEHAGMERWLAAVERASAWSPALAREVALAAQLVKGYGAVRRRMVCLFDELIDTVMRAGAIEHARTGDVSGATAFAEQYRTLVRQGPEGETGAQALARRVRGDAAGDRHPNTPAAAV
ncbi:MAG: indolepyruvate oxidoreductase subunit beta family protein [Candidatus Rokubacteria bacterium]|nr:indolepyruvate oxidoreductase subunit beta family protein [Candidatus Rokubacteria bacterium]